MGSSRYDSEQVVQRPELELELGELVRYGALTRPIVICRARLRADTAYSVGSSERARFMASVE